METALEKAIRLGSNGNQTLFAKKIDESPQTVNNWLKRGRVPAEHCPTIEKVFDGLVRCEELRPDVDWGYLRGTQPIAKIVATTRAQYGMPPIGKEV
jgi:DNA-binding transcriptional regulator YdaS (Cro superfamily)